MNQNANRNLITGFGFSILLLIISSAAALYSITNMLDSSKWVEHTNLVIERLENCVSATNEAETNQRGYLLTDNQQFIAPYITARNRANQLVETITNLTTDNPVQQQNCQELKKTVTDRLQQLAHVITLRTTNVAALAPELEKGRELMTQVRSIAGKMKFEEERLLQIRTHNLSRFAGVTPVIIVIAGLLAIIITIIFYWRVKNDFAQKGRMQRELEEKDRDITNRIHIIQRIATQIAKGDYTVRATDAEKDGLGNLSGSLNAMAQSLDYSFNLLNDKEWLQTGLAGLNEQMLSAINLQELTDRIINFLTTYTNSLSGALYITGTDHKLHLNSGYALTDPEKRALLEPGEGLAGQVLKTEKILTITDIPENQYSISFTAGQLKPAAVIAFPVIYDRQVTGVIELAGLHEYKGNTLILLEQAAQQIGIVLYSTQNRARVQEMLEETQAQAEELQAQHSELENMNSELEAQSQKLQASEEELKVQQEELLQANQELEERAHILEERNETIAQRNKDIQKKAEELALSTKYKSEFLANMSHELRTPLNSILLLSRLMSENNEQNLSPDQVEYAQVIQSSGNGLLALIDEILDLSKIEAGKMELEYQPLPVVSITEDMKGLFGPLAREKKLDFNIQINEDLPKEIETDKMRLEQILKNLLSNAFKFTAQGSVTLDIRNGGHDEMVFTVKDTGIGIPKDKQALVFEAFQQADGSTRRKYGGTGLGLSISRELAKLLGGELSVTSDTGAGASFILQIPSSKRAAEKTPAPARSEETAAFPELPALSSKPAETRIRFISDHIPEAIPDDRDSIGREDKVVLIVEDDTAFAKSLLDFTHKKGFKGIVAVRGDDGIRLAQTYLPMAILLDIQLPVKDGWEVMQELKGSVKTRHIPVHIMSSYAVKKESLQSGAVDFINKPFAYDQMADMFSKLETALKKEGKKVLIVEENPKHAIALSHFLETSKINSVIASSVQEGMEALQKKEVKCVILDMGIPDKNAYETLDVIRKNPSLEHVPIIIFTGESLSKAEEQRIKQYADSIVVKTAHSYKRMLDEVSLFLHLMEEKKKPGDDNKKFQKLGILNNILQHKTILIADDDVRNIFSLTKTLEQYGVNVVSAIDGKEALRLLDETPHVDLVLMDMMMPEMDGYETTQRIRKRPGTKNLPVIAVTAKTMMGDREKCISAGASDYISKPVDIDQLLSLLRVWLYQKNA